MAGRASAFGRPPASQVLRGIRRSVAKVIAVFGRVWTELASLAKSFDSPAAPVNCGLARARCTYAQFEPSGGRRAIHKLLVQRERRGGPTEWGDVRKVITSGISSFAKKFCVAGGATEKLISIADLYRRFLGGV